MFSKGSYEIPTTDITIDGLTIKSYNNEKVIFDGTKSIDELKETNSTWEKNNHSVASENGSTVSNTIIYRIKVKIQPKFQLFSNRKEVTVTRYPSAQWSDESV